MISLLPRTRKAWIRAVLVMSAPVLLLGAGFCYMTSMPGSSYRGLPTGATAAERALGGRLRAHVEKLAGEIGERNLDRYEALEASAVYIERIFGGMGYAPSAQVFKARGRAVRNIEVEIPGASKPGEIVVIGAHYDSVSGSPGADDNATGAAALLALARHFRGRSPARTLRFVAFVNEEPPYFQTDSMGSLVYARRCRARGEKVTAMLALETMGYYTDEPGSQRYPPLVGMAYPDRGDFVAFVGNLGSRGLVRRCLGIFRKQARFPSEGIAAPESLPGIGWSDHWAFWQQGYPGVMITDTAPFRYPHYHTASDTPAKIDYEALARVTEGLIGVIEELAELPPEAAPG